MAYNDIDSGKVLNKEGLLELCSQIKTEIANNSGGGASYTAGRGIDIDENNIIQTIVPQILYYDDGMGWNRSSNTKAQIIERLKNGEVVYNPSSSITIQVSELVPFGKLRILGPISHSTGMITNMTTNGSITLNSNYFYYYIQGQRSAGSSYEHSGVLLISSDGNFNSLIPYYDGTLTPQKTVEYLAKNKQDKLTAGTGITISGTTISADNQLPTALTTDGTYKLKCVVASGTPTYSWDTDSGGGTTYTAGTGISIVNGVISLDLATAEEGEF